MVIQGMYGLGDNIYQRAVVREIQGDVYLYTCWPQLYYDLPNIYPVKPTTRLRTQNKNMQNVRDSKWHKAPVERTLRMSYSAGGLKYGSILSALSGSVGVVPQVFDLPKFDKPDIDKPYAVVRPVTVRSEWYNRARGPKCEYVCRAADILRDKGYCVVSVADIAEKEWCEHIPESDIAYNHGELTLEKLMGIIQNAKIVVGGVGWIVPACNATGTPLITILGGQGGNNAPEKIIDKPMDDSKTSFIYPDNYCMCRNVRHDCDKTITDFYEKFTGALNVSLS